MHENLFPTETPNPSPWIILVLTLGGVVTVAWIEFLLWVAFKLGSWAVALI